MKWVTVWGNAISIAEHRVEGYAKNVTLRYPVTCSFGGDKIRLTFSNFCGSEPVTLKRVTVASALGDREITLNNAKVVTFNGKNELTMQPGEEIVSDPVDFHVRQGDAISVSIYIEEITQMRSAVVVTGPLSGGFFSVGDYTLKEVLPLNYTRTTSTYYFLTGIDLYGPDERRAVICYGDSITAQSFPDYMTKTRLDCPANNLSVVRRAASGTRVLREYDCITYESYGLSGEHRFEREIKSVSGADAVIIQHGINDIIHPVGTNINPFRPMSDLPTVEELCRGIEDYIAIAKRQGLKVLIGTLLPINGWRTYEKFREDMRREFNGWVRNLKTVDGIVDFDSAVRDKKDITKFATGNDSGDHLHPSEQAYKLMAQAALDAIGNITR